MHSAAPPLNSLRAFEATARHLSMKEAAIELNVTPGALSHQVRGLEEYLGVALFVRKPRAIELTDAGRALLPGLTTGFTAIGQALDALRLAQDEQVLVISTPPGFTAKWLAPRLYRFASDNPELDTRISSSLKNANFAIDGVDVAIRNLATESVLPDDLVSHGLVPIITLPVCTPEIAERYGPFRHPSDLLQAPLIHDETFMTQTRLPGWNRWMEEVGVKDAEVSRGLHFNSADHALDAAAQGAGVLLGQALLAHDDLASGRLQVAFDHPAPIVRHYHLVYPKRHADRPPIVAFKKWLDMEIDRLDPVATRHEKAG